MDEFINRLTNWKTTIVGVSTAIIAILVTFGVVGSGESEDAVAQISTIWEGILAFLAGVSGLILVFSKDTDKT